METNDVVYFELDNWFAGEHFPDAEPFLTWLTNDLCIRFLDDNWCKENKLCVVATIIDMSWCFCISASKSWIEENCPKLLTDELCGKRTKYSDFICTPNENGKVYGKLSGMNFLNYCEENYGVHEEFFDP